MRQPDVWFCVQGLALAQELVEAQLRIVRQSTVSFWTRLGKVCSNCSDSSRDDFVSDRL